MKSLQPDDCVDIVIVGAGLVGTPLAHVLVGQGWSVALLDKGQLTVSTQAVNTGLSQRCTALSLGTKRWFDRQNLWRQIEPDASPIEHVLVSHKGHFGSTRLHAHELGTEALGYVISNDFLSGMLTESLAQSSVHYIPNASVSSVEVQDDAVCVCYGESRLRARLLVAADGISSLIRESVGIQTAQVDYEQSAVLGNVVLENEHQQVAYERFTADGPLALLPRHGKNMSFVECIDSQDAASIGELDDDAYLNRLQQRFGFRLGRFAKLGDRFITPLMRIEATQQVAQRTVLLGNAMRLLHPVGGQGYNLAIRDLAHLQKMLAQHSSNSSSADPGDAALLARFENERITDQQRTVQFTDALARGFRGTSKLPGHVRALGLSGLDCVSPLRKRFAIMTMGVAG